MVYDLHWRRFIEIVRTINTIQSEEVRERFVYEAYTPWIISSMFGNNKSFGDFLKSLGLANQEPTPTPQSRALDAQTAIASAEQIKAMDNKR